MSMKGSRVGVPLLLSLLCGAAVGEHRASAQTGGGGVTEVSITGGQRALLKLAVVSPSGDGVLGAEIAKTGRRDFLLSSLFQVLDE